MSSNDLRGNAGTLYGVGVGPGDPDLLTLKAARILKNAPVIFTPRAEGTCTSVALEIVKDIIDDGLGKLREVTVDDVLATGKGLGSRIVGRIARGFDEATRKD